LVSVAQTTFSRLYWNYPYTSLGLSVANDDNYIYINGRGASIIDGYNIPNKFFIKTDFAGNAVITESILSDLFYSFREGYTSGLEFLNDSTLISAGTYTIYDTLFPPFNSQHNGMLYVYNINGDTIFTKKYIGDGYTEFNRLVQLDSTIILGGFTSDTITIVSPAYIISVDQLGGLIWESRLGIGYQFESTGLMDNLSSGSVVSGGAIINDIVTGDLIRNGKIYKLDAFGNDYYANEFGTPGDDSEIEVKISRNEQSYILRQYLDTVINEGDYNYVQYIGKTDTNLNFIWRTFLNDKYYKYIYTLRTFEDGSIVAVGATIVDETYEPHGYIIKLDSNGTVLWERDYTNVAGSHNYLYDFQKMPDGGFICSGMGGDTIDGVIQSMCWLLRLDSMGCLIPGCDEVSVPDIAVNSETFLNIYPNPFGDAATVEFHLPQDFAINGTQALRLDIYDMQGRLIDGYSNIYPSNPGETIRFKMYRNTMTAGNYLATLKYGDQVLNTIQFVLK
jgi:hypothetical protein